MMSNTITLMPKFGAQHYNAIAYDIRGEFPSYAGTKEDKRETNCRRATLVGLALRLAHRFKEDNPLFDPLRFLDACSPNTDLWPLSELWEENDG